MRTIWVKIDPWDKQMVTTAIEGGADGLWVPDGCSDKVRALGKILTIAEDGDLKIGRDVVCFSIQGTGDEAEIIRLGREKKVILQTEDWTIIPLENLIAQDADVIMQVRNLEEARTAFGILEKGVEHILLHPSDTASLKTALTALKSEEENTPLTPAKIISVVPAGMGDRVCVDTCTNMTAGQGLLVGNSSSALFLIHSESISNPYVAPRPFRVNAGAVHAYTRVPGGKTRYLAELCAGDDVLIVDYTGRTTVGTVGRLKIEKRPLMLVTAKIDDRTVSTIVQNAETIRLTRPDGGAVSVVKLNKGDEVMMAVETAGRHFGHKIEETITEK
jgi:3-dehydroquinate synthase II